MGIGPSDIGTKQVNCRDIRWWC